MTPRLGFSNPDGSRGGLSPTHPGEPARRLANCQLRLIVRAIRERFALCPHDKPELVVDLTYAVLDGMLMETTPLRFLMISFPNRQIWKGFFSIVQKPLYFLTGTILVVKFHVQFFTAGFQYLVIMSELPCVSIQLDAVIILERLQNPLHRIFPFEF